MKPHTLHRLLSSLYNSPHLCDQRTFEFATNFLEQRSKAALMVPQMPEDDDEDIPDDIDDFSPEMGVGVIDVCGPLTYRQISGMCGDIGCSYEGILDQAEDMIEAGAKIIILNVDSGGGEGYSAFETANELRKKCDEYGVKIFSYNDGCMASAAYVFGCVADVVVSNPYAETGSIGVLISLLDKSKALDDAGLKPIYISAGGQKIPFNEDNTFKQSFLDDLQVKVDALYEDFVSHVSSYTGLSAEAIKATEAKTFMADEALSIGLVNKILTRSEFVQYVLDQQKGVPNA